MVTDPRMYKEFKNNVSLFVGCRNDCVYCRNTFQKQAKRRPCALCKAFEPHEHPERLEKRPNRRHMRLCGFGDISFVSDEYMKKVIEYAKKYPKTEFLVQSKNPSIFLKYEWSDNVILCATLECDGSLVDYGKISKAEPPEKRIDVMKQLHHRKAITVEPVLDFDAKIFPLLIQDIKPEWVWVGYDSRPKKHHLQEPALEKPIELIKTLEDAGITVRKKLIRKAWYEDKAENNSMRKLGDTKERRKKKRQGDNKDNQGR
ncbi:MAG TPA: hypothetical protein VKL21_03995 [Candidatus Methanoperedens sp.]|nr:hypothetical protein [Candidatus Methanoperedens sp.]